MQTRLSRLLSLAAPLALLAACASEPAAPEAAPEPAHTAPVTAPAADAPAVVENPAPAHLTVRQAQQALADKGYDPGVIDGLSGPRTAAALRQFQRDQGLAATGRLDAVTMEALAH
ncbi:MAG: peptidoglycan-binding domain-containing protein [Pseudomonadota bacterium]|nr:peptidoglycan-binding domain-containing protein [Pseudomonadota bacterium]